MDIETSNAIRLFFPNPSLVMVYFEAIANALDAEATDISINIEIKSFDEQSSLKVTIKDNGNGFNDENFGRFKTLLKPRDKFHKGIGRLLFLDYFKRIRIDSIWDNKRRKFTFCDPFDENVPVQEYIGDKTNSSTLVFSEFKKSRIYSYDDLKPDHLKEQIIDHFLPTFLEMHRKKTDFNISLNLHTNSKNEQKEFFSTDVEITSNDLPDMTLIKINDNAIDAIDPISMYFHIKKHTGKAKHLIAFSIDGRTIPANLIQPSSIPLGYSIVFLFEADFFNASSDHSRQKLTLPEGLNEIYLKSILRNELGKVLAEKIPAIAEKNSDTEQQFEELFPHLLGYFEENTVGLIDRDDALNRAQQDFFKDQKQVLQCDELDDATYEKSLELSSRSLTEYILYRDKIIRRMKAITEENSEADIHNLITPRYSEFTQEDIASDVYRNNAWLLDDKFMTFSTILSEGRMDTVVNAIRLDDKETNERGRPDISMIFSADPETEEAVDVVVVEIKKKTSDEKENQYAINQLLDRATKLAEHCPNIQRIWYYAIIEIDDTMITRLRQQKWAPLFSKGTVFYQEFPTQKSDGTEVPTPMFILSFDAIVADAESRNHTFLEILRSGMKKHTEQDSKKT